MNIRKKLFTIMKKNEYQTINSKYHEIKENIEYPSKINSEKLKEFLSFVTKNSRYYNNLDIENINDYPILTKEKLKQNFKNIITVDETDLNNYPFMTTSGSYGTPFKFHVSKDKRLSQQAEVLYFGLLSNFDIGTKHIYCRTVQPSLKSRIVKNQFLLRPDKIDKDWIINAIKYIQDVKPEVIISYPSVLNNISIFMMTHKIKLAGIKGIICIGEGILDDARVNISNAFGVAPYSRYSTEELGVLGNNYGNGTKMILNQVNYLIEVLDDNNNPVKTGETGKVVVTDFNSIITPLVRYDTGDIATVSQVTDGLVYEIDNLEGRKVEIIYNTNSEPLTPFTINSVMRTYEDVLQFQFTQHDRTKYEMKILPLDVNNHENYDGVASSLQELLGTDASINLNIVSEIETLKSGKRPYIINLYRKA